MAGNRDELGSGGGDRRTGFGRCGWGRALLALVALVGCDGGASPSGADATQGALDGGADQGAGVDASSTPSRPDDVSSRPGAADAGPTGSGSPWSVVTAAEPLPAPRSEAVFLPTSVPDTYVLFGGFVPKQKGATFAGDTWLLALTPGGPSGAWSPVEAGGPPRRAGACGAYDSKRGVSYVFGGFDKGLQAEVEEPFSIDPYYSDLWAFSPSPTPAWTPVYPGGPTPTAPGAALAQPRRSCPCARSRPRPAGHRASRPRPHLNRES